MLQDDPTPGPLKPDLKHDTLEYAAPTEGEDILDLDHESAQEIEDEEITADELEQLDEAGQDEQGAALNTVETDRLTDEDNFLTETATEETFEDQDEGEEEERIRK